MSKLRVFSGKCCLCDVGHEVNAKDYMGEPIHTGDIVMIWHGEYIDTESECWYPAGGLTVVVNDQYSSVGDGRTIIHREKEGQPDPFVMGIKGCGFNDPSWQVHIVKKHSDVIDGEHWPAYGFSYQKATGESS